MQSLHLHACTVARPVVNSFIALKFRVVSGFIYEHLWASYENCRI